jgi:thiamine-phosphate pyrophosphorylase
MLRCYITDRHGCPDLMECIVRAAMAGVDFIQIREKDLNAGDLLDLTRRAVSVAAPWPVKVLVNTRLDVALAAGAHGIHLPADSTQPVEWRRITPPGFLVGVSCHSFEEVRLAEAADFVVYGPVFSTPGKSPAVGLGALREITRASEIPVLALGGITSGNAQSCVDAGAAGIAAIRMFQEPNCKVLSR